MGISKQLLGAATFGFQKEQPKGGIWLSAADLKNKKLQWAEKPVATTRSDIKKWKDALDLTKAEEPKNYSLQLLYDEAVIDARATSQIENRKNQVFSADFVIRNKSGEIDEEQTKVVKSIYRKLTSEILESIPRGYSLIELSLVQDASGKQQLEITSIPRTNVVPQKGYFYPDYTEDKFISYRDMPEYGTWILEFNSESPGLINKAIPHVLFKKFAQSCWSELCEIYGIPPRVLKTNTQDKNMLNRGEQMMQDMGAASWFIIDQHEEFEFAKGVVTKGEVYDGLINLCNNEISMLFSGAIIGQDTKYGTRGKEQSSQDILWEVIQSDMHMVEDAWNKIVIPALVKIGILKGEITFEYEPAEDLGELWNRVKDIVPYAEMDKDWMNEKFGLNILSFKSQSPTKSDEKLKLDEDFFV